MDMKSYLPSTAACTDEHLEEDALQSLRTLTSAVRAQRRHRVGQHLRMLDGKTRTDKSENTTLLLKRPGLSTWRPDGVVGFPPTLPESCPRGRSRCGFRGPSCPTLWRRASRGEACKPVRPKREGCLHSRRYLPMPNFCQACSDKSPLGATHISKAWRNRQCDHNRMSTAERRAEH